MAGKSTTHTDAVLNVLRGTNITAPTTVYVGLLSAAPANDGVAGTELSGSGYVRQAITFSAPTTDAGNVRKIANDALVTFGPASADWASATHFAIFNHATNGLAANYLYWDALTTAKTVQNGDRGEFAIGSLVVKED